MITITSANVPVECKSMNYFLFDLIFLKPKCGIILFRFLEVSKFLGICSYFVSALMKRKFLLQFFIFAPIFVSIFTTENIVH